MAYAKDALQELKDGKLYLHVTPGRAQAMVEALDIALDSGELDKRVKGITFTLFGITATPTLNATGAVVNAVIALALGIYAWGSVRLRA